MKAVFAMPMRSAAHAMAAALFFALIPAGHALRAQPAPQQRPGLERALTIRQFNALARRQRVRTPVGRSVGRQAEWLEMKTVYDLGAPAPEWIDELAFRYHLMLALPPENRGDPPRYSLFQITVLYADIQHGRNRNSTVFLRPPALLRFGEPVAAAVEILHEGKLIAESSEESPDFARQIPKGEKWFRNPAVMDSKAVTRRDGYLLNRAQSPWVLTSPDDYEYIKP